MAMGGFLRSGGGISDLEAHGSDAASVPYLRLSQCYSRRCSGDRLGMRVWRAVAVGQQQGCAGASVVQGYLRNRAVVRVSTSIPGVAASAPTDT